MVACTYSVSSPRNSCTKRSYPTRLLPPISRRETGTPVWGPGSFSSCTRSAVSPDQRACSQVGGACASPQYPTRLPGAQGTDPGGGRRASSMRGESQRPFDRKGNKGAQTTTLVKNADQEWLRRGEVVTKTGRPNFISGLSHWLFIHSIREDSVLLWEGYEQLRLQVHTLRRSTLVSRH